MASLDKARLPAQLGGGLALDLVGPALVAHLPGTISPAARALASTLPADPEHDLIIVDFPVDAAERWEQLASALARRGKGVRLVLETRASEKGARAGRWLSGRLGRAVVAPQGTLHRGLSGCQFVGGPAGSGWTCFLPGRPPEWLGTRYPSPSWDSRAVSAPFQLGSASEAEPLPCGMWLRPPGRPGLVDADRTRLVRSVPCQPEVLTVILGGRQLKPFSAADVKALWQVLPLRDRAKVRFVHYGPVAVPAGRSLGPYLADLVGAEVRCYTGIPLGGTDGLEVRLLRADGSLGWRSHVEELIHPARAAGASEPAPPGMSTRRQAPLSGLSEIGPATYRIAEDLVLEVVQAGLWVRPDQLPPHAGIVRAAVPDPASHRLFYEDATPEMARRTWDAAQQVLAALDYSTRLITVTFAAGTLAAKPLPAPETPSPDGTAAAAHVDVPFPHLTQLLDLKSIFDTAPATHVAESRLGIADVLSGSAAPLILPDPEGLEASRRWMRSNLPDEFGPLADPLRRVLSTTSDLLAGKDFEDALTDAVALRQLLDASNGLDEGLRFDKSGSLIHIAACAAEALTALPVHRGGTVAALTAPPQREELSELPVCEPGFYTVLGRPALCQQGESDLFVWSMTGRITMALEQPGDLLLGRVVFKPGTWFKVLSSVPPTAGQRGRVLVRELAGAELPTASAGQANGRSLDRIAKISLLRFADTAGTADPVAVPAAGRLFRLPGSSPRLYETRAAR
jgi:hypothetical protein